MRLKIVFVIWFVGLLTACSDNSLTFVDGGKKNLTEFKERWLLINYWAAWCKPCLKEIPELNEFNARPDAEVLAFNFDQLDEVSLKEQIKKFDIQYKSLIGDPAELFKQDKPTGLPATMVINPEGRFVKWLHGEQNKETLFEVLNSENALKIR